MKVHLVNAGTMHPRLARLTVGAPRLVCRCLLIEVDDRTIAVDAGIGLRDIAEPVRRLGEDWMRMTRPTLDPAETLARQAADIRITDVILTHNHRDHVGGLADLPDARVHCLPQVRAQVEQIRANPDSDPRAAAQWEHQVRWAGPPAPASRWETLDTYTLDGIDPRVRLIPLPGHAVGHAGVLVEQPGAPAVLHVGDAAFHPTQYDTGIVPPGIRYFARATQLDPQARRTTERRLRALPRQRLQIVTAHGPIRSVTRGRSGHR